MTPKLRTGRLLLRQLRSADAPALAELIGDYEVSKWLTVVPHPYSRAEAVDFIAFARQGDGSHWAITRDDALLGVIGLDDGLGYWLGRPFWGQGIMSEAAQAVVTHWHATGVGDLTSGYFTGNQGSRRILEGLGFVPDGQARVTSVAQGREVTLNRMVLHRP